MRGQAWAPQALCFHSALWDQPCTHCPGLHWDPCPCCRGLGGPSLSVLCASLVFLSVPPHTRYLLSPCSKAASCRGAHFCPWGPLSVLLFAPHGYYLCQSECLRFVSCAFLSLALQAAVLSLVHPCPGMALALWVSGSPCSVWQPAPCLRAPASHRAIFSSQQPGKELGLLRLDPGPAPNLSAG